ncbi:RNA recognition motif domain - like 10 [Theobroma cacao]|nr:RNA recognition motif domain - like 10 [Theobroma cacao]
MAVFLSCQSPLSSSLQPPKLSTINSKRSISIAHIPKTFRRSYPSLTHQPICCSNSSSQSESHSSTSAGVFIKGLPQSTAEGRLKRVFSQFGEVKQGEHVYQSFLFGLSEFFNVVRERVSKQSLGSAFVWFDEEQSAQLAVKEMNGKFFDGRFILVKIATPGLSKNRGRATPYRF